MQIHLIGFRDSPDHSSLRNKEVKFIRIYSLGPRFSVLWRITERESVYRGLFLNKENIFRIFTPSGHWKLFVIKRCPYREV